ncbi:DUF4276 family protein [Pseudoxanthomonas sp. LARHCG66]|jgi:hypothetical protein
MRELVFLLEEESAKALLDSMLPRFLDPTIALRFIAFEGKQDLEGQLTRRLRGYMNPNARFVVLRDQDSHPDCKLLKQRLADLVAASGRADATVVRIACRELEAFYLADLDAVQAAIKVDGIAALQGKAKYRVPDSFGSPSQEVRTLTGGMYQKVNGSREIGKYLDLENERSASFKSLIGAVRRHERELLTLDLW